MKGGRGLPSGTSAKDETRKTRDVQSKEGNERWASGGGGGLGQKTRGAKWCVRCTAPSKAGKVYRWRAFFFRIS